MELEMIVTDAQNLDIAEECEKIAYENNVKNGGELKYWGLFRDAKYIVCAINDGKVVGYAYLVENFLDRLLKKSDLYIYQIAVKKDCQHMGIGKSLMEFICNHSKGYAAVTSNVNQKNINSIKLHSKVGMENIGECNLGYIFIKYVENIKNNSKMEDMLKPTIVDEIEK